MSDQPLNNDRLIEMFRLQLELQSKAYGKDPRELAGTERIEFFKNMKLALQDELHEALDEIGWKPWATSKHWNEEAVKGELVDAWHFFMNLCIVADMSPRELHRRYLAKRQKNIARQEAGYDGVSTKCPVCKRALDDDAVFCRIDRVSTPDGTSRRVWCAFDNQWYFFKGDETIEAKVDSDMASIKGPWEDNNE